MTACAEIPLLEGATHCFVSASTTSSPRRIPFRAEHGLHVGSTNHFALLNHPAVYERLRDWLATPPEALA